MAKKGFTTLDAELFKSVSLPSSAGTAYSNGIDTGPLSSLGVRTEPFELLVETPGLTATMLPASTSASYELQNSESSTFESVISYSLKGLDQTGGDSGTVGNSFSFRPALESKQFWRLAVTTSGTTGTGINGKSASLKIIC